MRTKIFEIKIYRLSGNPDCVYFLIKLTSTDFLIYQVLRLIPGTRYFSYDINIAKPSANSMVQTVVNNRPY